MWTMLPLTAGLVRHQLSGHDAAALQHSVDLLVGDFRGDALGLEAGGLGQAQLRLQGGGGSGHKASSFFTLTRS